MTDQIINILEEKHAMEDGSDEVMKFRQFIDRSTFARKRGSDDINLIDRNGKNNRTFCVPTKLMPEFFRLYEACRKADKLLYFMEKAVEPKTHICLKVDCDFIMNTDNVNAIDGNTIKLFIKKITKIISTYFQVPEDSQTLFVAVFRRPNCTYKEDVDGYKYGLHIKFYFRAGKAQRLFLIKKLKEDLGPELPKIFRKCADQIMNLSDVDAIFDSGAITAPALLAGAVKPGSLVPYFLDSVYKIDTEYEDSMLEVVELPDDANIAQETSLIYDGSVIPKPVYSIEPAYAPECEEEKYQNVDVDHMFDEADILNVFRERNENADYVYHLLMLIPVSYADRREDWMKFMGMLSFQYKISQEIGWKVIAKAFSKRSEKYSDHDFEVNWSDCVVRGYYSDFGIDNLVRIAYATSNDNEEAFETMMKTCVVEMIQRQLRNNQGEFTHWGIAQLLHIKFREQAFCQFPKGSTPVWGWFVTSPGRGDLLAKQQLYKWRIYAKTEPPEFSVYISKQIHDILRVTQEIMTTYANSLGDSEQDKAKRKSYIGFSKQIGRSAKQLQVHSFKVGCLKECTDFFRRPNTLEVMDTDGLVLGVPEGVLELELTEKNPRVRFVQGFHNHKVTKSTNAKFLKGGFDVENPLHKQVFMRMREPFLDTESSAFWLWFFAISHGLTDVTNFQHALWGGGGGSNGKTTITSLIQNTFNGDEEMGYCKTIDYKALAGGKVKGGNNATPELASLVESRIAIIAEMPKNTKYDEAIMKNLTGGEAMPYRRLYQDRKQRRCNSIPMFISNHMFDMTGVTDYGNWRRPKIYFFKKKFVKDPDPENPLEVKIDTSIISEWVHLPDVQSAFFMMIVAFYEIDYMINKGNPYNYPSPIMDYEKQEFRNKSDHINEFITKRVVKPKSPDKSLSDDDNSLGNDNLSGDDNELPSDNDLSDDDEKKGEEKPPVSIIDFCNAFNEWSETRYGNIITDAELIEHFEESAIRKNLISQAGKDPIVEGCRPLTKEEQHPMDDEEYFLKFSPEGFQEDPETPEESWEKFKKWYAMVKKLGDDGSSDDSSTEDFEAV